VVPRLDAHADACLGANRTIVVPAGFRVDADGFTTAGRQRTGDEEKGAESSHGSLAKHDMCRAQLRASR
jgi:hypothetical protein